MRPAAAHALRAVDVVKAGGVHVEAHLAVRGVDEHVVGSAGKLQVAFRLQLRGGLVVDDLVGAENVVAVVDDHVAGEGQVVADAASGAGLPLDGHAGCGLGLRLGDGQNLLAGIVGER